MIVFADEVVGLYQVQFRINGEWVVVTVDDLLPMGANGIAYARSGEDGETWVSIVEKAYAKVNGCYQNLEGGSVGQALADLTGGFSEILEFGEPIIAEAIKTGALWKRLLRYKEEGFLMGCAFSAGAGAVEKDRGQGILGGHAYTVVDVREVARGMHRLLRVRNPWGQGEWRGRWADGSSQWTKAILAELNYSFGDDGTFWISFEDWVRQFSKLYVCRLYEDDIGDKWSAAKFAGRWEGSTAGGSMNHATWPENPQYGIRFPSGAPGKKTRVFVSLGQRDVRPLGAGGFTSAIGFYVLRAGGPTLAGGKKASITSESEIVYRGVFSFDRDVAAEVTLGTDEAYIVLPATFEAAQEMPFWLSIFSETPMEAAEVQAGPEALVESAWKFENAGGSPNNPEWKKNKQWALLPLEPCEVTITLGQPPVRAPKQVNPIGLQVFSSSTGSRTAFTQPLAQSEYLIGPAVSVTAWADPSRGPLIIVPSTFTPMQTGKFFLKISASSPFVLGPAARAGEAWQGIALVGKAAQTGVMADAAAGAGAGEGVRWYTSGAKARQVAEARPVVPTIMARGAPAVEASGNRSARSASSSRFPAIDDNQTLTGRSASTRARSPSPDLPHQDDQDLVEETWEQKKMRELGIDLSRASKRDKAALRGAESGLLQAAISFNLWSRVNPGFSHAPVQTQYQMQSNYDPEEARRVSTKKNNRVKNDYTEFVEYRARHANLLKTQKKN